MERRRTMVCGNCSRFDTTASLTDDEIVILTEQITKNYPGIDSIALPTYRAPRSGHRNCSASGVAMGNNVCITPLEYRDIDG